MTPDEYDLLGKVTFTGPEVAKMAGWAQVNALDPHRAGRLLGLRPVGQGNYRKLTARQAVIACVVASILDQRVPVESGRRAEMIADVLRAEEWSDWLAVNDDGHRWLSSPESVAAVARAHSPLTTTAVPLTPYVSRVLARARLA